MIQTLVIIAVVFFSGLMIGFMVSENLWIKRYEKLKQGFKKSLNC